MISVEAEGSDPLKKSKEPTRKDGVWGTESDPKKRLKTTHPAKPRTAEGPQTSVCAIGPEGGYFAALRRSLGVASQSSWPLGGTRRVSSTRATPAFFSEVM